MFDSTKVPPSAFNLVILVHDPGEINKARPYFSDHLNENSTSASNTSLTLAETLASGKRESLK